MHHEKAACILERLLEFERVAVVLDMSTDECLGILNLPAVVYYALRTGNSDAVHLVKPELERRLSYAMPLMRRLATQGAAARAPSPATLVSA